MLHFHSAWPGGGVDVRNIQRRKKKGLSVPNMIRYTINMRIIRSRIMKDLHLTSVVEQLERKAVEILTHLKTSWGKVGPGVS